MKLIDTAVAIDHLRGHAPATALIEGLLTSADPVVSSELVRFELVAGVRDDETDALEDFFTVVSWAPVTEEIARRAGSFARRFSGSHAGIDDVDYLLAATAVELDAELLTTNVGHFPMLRGLRPAY